MRDIMEDFRSGKLKIIRAREDMLDLAVASEDLKTSLVIVANLLELPLTETPDGKPGEVWDGVLCYNSWDSHWPNVSGKSPFVKALTQKVPEGKVRAFRINEERIVVVEHVSVHHEGEGSVPSYFRFLKARKATL